MSRNDELFARAQRTIPGRRQLAGARLPLGRRHAALLRRAARAPTCGTPTASATSTTSARGARRSSATRIRRSCARCRRPRAHGLSFGAPTELEIEMAETLCRLLPSLELVRLVSSGTEATMTRAAARARLHRPQQDRQVRRLLSRPRRQPAGEGGLGRADVRPAVVGRRAAARSPRDARARLQRPRRRSRRAFAARRRRHRRASSSSRSPAT